MGRHYKKAPIKGQKLSFYFEQKKRLHPIGVASFFYLTVISRLIISEAHFE